MLVATSTRLGRAALLLVEVALDTELLAIELLAGPVEQLVTRANTILKDLPCKLVAVPDPEVDGLTQSLLDGLGVEDLLQQNALGVVLGVAAEVEVILMDHGVGSLDNVEGVESDADFLAVAVEILGSSRKRRRNRILLKVSPNSDIGVPRTV